MQQTRENIQHQAISLNATNLSKFSQMALIADQCGYGQVNENAGQLESWLWHGSLGGLYLNGQLFGFQLFWMFLQCRESTKFTALHFNLFLG